MTIDESKVVETVEFRVSLNTGYEKSPVHVGATDVCSLYDFLKEYNKLKGRLDNLFTKIVRDYLGSDNPVNKDMRGTLEKNPQRFGLYNNGVVIGVKDFVREDNLVKMTLPITVINGRQTLCTIWDICREKEKEGEWRSHAENNPIVVKIVREPELDRIMGALEGRVCFSNNMGTLEGMGYHPTQPWRTGDGDRNGSHAAC